MKKAILQITLDVPAANRAMAGEIYARYKAPFLSGVGGAESKELLLRDDDVQVLHTFDSRASVEAYLGSGLFGQDIVSELRPLLQADPEIRIYERQ
jgi:hypothetical protein